jgi:hypothetical protein
MFMYELFASVLTCGVLTGPANTFTVSGPGVCIYSLASSALKVFVLCAVAKEDFPESVYQVVNTSFSFSLVPLTSKKLLLKLPTSASSVLTLAKLRIGKVSCGNQ